MDTPPEAHYVVVSTGGRVLAEYVNFTGDFHTLSAIREAALQRSIMKREEIKGDSLLTINKSTWYCGIHRNREFVILVVWGRKLQKADREFLSKLGDYNMWREGLDEISFKQLLYVRDLINHPSGGHASEPTILALYSDSDVRYVLEHAFVAQRGPAAQCGQLICESIDSIASFAELLKMRQIGLEWLKKDPSVEGYSIRMEKNNCFGFHVKNDMAFFVACSKYGDSDLYAVPDEKLDEHASDVIERFLETLAKELKATFDRPAKKLKTEGHLSVNALLRDSMKSSNKEFFERLEQLVWEYSEYVSTDEEEKEESGSTSETEDESLDMEKSSDSENTGVN